MNKPSLRRSFCILNLAFIMGWSQKTFALDEETLANLSLEELALVQVSTISRIDESIDRAAGSVYVYSRNVIEKRGYRSLRELLQVVPGFTVFHRDLQYVAGVRGLTSNENEKITLLVNGQEFNQVNEPEFLNGPINLDNVEKIEVVVGPSSLFQQANTLAATVNVITKNINGSEVYASVGNYLPYSATVVKGKEWDKNEFANFSFTTEQKKGFDAWNHNFRENLDGRKITGQLDWASFFSVLNGKKGDWSAQAIAYRSLHPELDISNGARSNDAQQIDQMYSLFLKNDHAVTDEFERFIQASATLKDQTRLNYNGLPINGLQQANKQAVYNAELGSRYRGIKNNLIQTGAQFSYDHNYEFWYTLNQAGPPELVIPKSDLVTRDSHAFGLYLDDTFNLSERLRLIGGLRIDKNTRLKGDKWHNGGRAAIVVDVTKNWISKLFFNRAVRMPSPMASPLNKAWGIDKPDAPPFVRFSTNATKPEILSTIEFQNIFYVGHVRFGTSIYHQDLKDFISWLEPHTNVGNFRGYGVEVNFQAPLNATLTAWGNASLNDSRLYARRPPVAKTVDTAHLEVNEDFHIIGSAKYTVNLGADYEFTHQINFSPSVRYFTEQAGFDFTSQEFKTINNRYYLDASFTWRSLKKTKDFEMDAILSGQNILNNRRQIAGQWMRDTYAPMGTSVVLTLRIRL